MKLDKLYNRKNNRAARREGGLRYKYDHNSCLNCDHYYWERNKTWFAISRACRLWDFRFYKYEDPNEWVCKKYASNRSEKERWEVSNG